jgi:HPt (histidine-containing phosphotransfer) domain-containing protein
MSDPLAPLRAKFAARCIEDLAVLRSDDTAPEERRRVIHRIAGAAGMFGFAALGALAGRLDDQAAAGEAPDPGDFAALLAALEGVMRPSEP